MAEAYHAANNYLVVRLQLHGDSHDELPIFYEAADEIKRLRAERDEARQRYCFAMAEHGEEAEARQNAKDEGWDCFKENSND